MKLLGSVLALMLSFATPIAQVPGVPGPVSLTIVAVGDTVVVTPRWGAGTSATSYNVTLTVAATNGSWSSVRDSLNCNVDANCGRVPGAGIGVIANTPGLYIKKWLTAIPWDSATFTASVVSKNSAGLSAAVSGSKRVLRLPGPPGPITFDSLSVAALMTLPHSTRDAPLVTHPEFTVVTCTLVGFRNGVYAMRARDPCAPGLYEALPAAERAVTPAQQARADSTCLIASAPWGGTAIQEVCP